MNALEVTADNFDAEVLNSSIPVVVDFWASWCVPCTTLSPIIDELATELTGKVKVTKLNIETSSSISTQYQIVSIPTLILFKDGQIVGTMKGGSSKSNISEWISSLI